MRFTYLGNLPVAALMWRCQDGNATKMYLKGHDVLWPFQRHPELLRTPSIYVLQGVVYLSGIYGAAVADTYLLE